MSEATIKQAAYDERQRTLWGRLKFFHSFDDGRFEDLRKGRWYLNVTRDLTAGLIVAMVAIPMAMGFAMACGLRPEHGIVSGALAGLVGSLFGGSKFQVHGPTAAFIPIIGAMAALHGHPFVVLTGVIAGAILMMLGLARLGRMVEKVPHSIVVGFTIGIAVTIAFAQAGEAFGLRADLGPKFVNKVAGLAANIGQVNWYAVLLAGGTFIITRQLLKTSKFIPGPLIAIGLMGVLAGTVFSNKGLLLVKDKYGAIPTNFWVFSKPMAIQWNGKFLWDLAYFVIAVVFVAGVESLLCSRMADRVAENKGVKYHPDKELWGLGMLNIVVSLFNGMPLTGALARTATAIEVGVVSPLGGIFKCVLKLLLAAYLATYLQKIPMACIGGMMLYIATGMVKVPEIKGILAEGRRETAVMIYTAVAVVLTDFLTGVLSAIVLHAVLKRLAARRENEVVTAPLADEPAE